MKYKELDIYQRIKSLIKQSYQLRGIVIKKDIHLSDKNVEYVYDKYIKGVSCYVDSLEREKKYGYFSHSSVNTSVYAYVYWIMLKGLLEEKIDDVIVEELKSILLKCQGKDGLCSDPNIMNLQYLNGDGWGARHLMPHYFIAMERLGIKPNYELNYLAPFHDAETVEKLLCSLNWQHPWESSNTVMNIGVGLLYERDFLKIDKANSGIEAIQKWLLENIRPDCGMWGIGNFKSKYFKYQMVRGAYHMYCLLIYDNVDFPYQDKAIDCILDLQNNYGGYDFRINSSACEDIDAIEPLIRLSLLNPNYRKIEIKESAKRSLFWVVQNQTNDGGCVFRLGESICYGCENMYSKSNQSNLFATWFRTLSVCYMYDYLTGNLRNYTKIGGYEYPLY